MSSRVRLAASATALLLPLALAACGSDSSTVASPSSAPAAASSAPGATASSSAAVHTVSLTVRSGKVTGDTGRADVKRGETVDVAVNADVAEEVHIHGYDLMVDTVPGQTVHKQFVATIPGIFEIELEQTKLPLTRLQVQ